MQIKPKVKRKPLVNITSLIDVLFLLLIFFMVSSTFLEEPGMKLTLPEAESAEIGEKKQYTLYITKEGEFFLNNAPINSDSLKSAIEAVADEMEDETLTLKADKETAHGQVVLAMDVARGAGVKKLIVATNSRTDSAQKLDDN